MSQQIEKFDRFSRLWWQAVEQKVSIFCDVFLIWLSKIVGWLAVAISCGMLIYSVCFLNGQCFVMASMVLFFGLLLIRQSGLVRRCKEFRDQIYEDRRLNRVGYSSLFWYTSLLNTNHRVDQRD